MLDANVKNQLNTYLQNLKHPVELVVSIDDSPKAQELPATSGLRASRDQGALVPLGALEGS